MTLEHAKTIKRDLRYLHNKLSNREYVRMLANLDSLLEKTTELVKIYNECEYYTDDRLINALEELAQELS